MLVGFTQSTINFTSADTVTFRSSDLPRKKGVSNKNNNNNNNNNNYYYYYYYYLLWRCDPTRVMASSFLRFLDHTQRRTTVGRTPLDE